MDGDLGEFRFAAYACATTGGGHCLTNFCSPSGRDLAVMREGDRPPEFTYENEHQRVIYSRS